MSRPQSGCRQAHANTAVNVMDDPKIGSQPENIVDIDSTCRVGPVPPTGLHPLTPSRLTCLKQYCHQRTVPYETGPLSHRAAARAEHRIPAALSATRRRCKQESFALPAGAGRRRPASGPTARSSAPPRGEADHTEAEDRRYASWRDKDRTKQPPARGGSEPGLRGRAGPTGRRPRPMRIVGWSCKRAIMWRPRQDSNLRHSA